MIRARFKASLEDPRPINWPVKHPFWVTGESNAHSIVVSYADNEKYIYDNWPEAEDLIYHPATHYDFTSRFQQPDWFNEDGRSSKHRFTRDCGCRIVELDAEWRAPEDRLFDVLYCSQHAAAPVMYAALEGLIEGVGNAWDKAQEIVASIREANNER
jgi:hypothetical protein